MKFLKKLFSLFRKKEKAVPPPKKPEDGDRIPR